MENKKKVFILSGPAGAGKNTLWDLLKPLCKDFIEESISMTTRSPRIWEIDWKHYHFITEVLFQDMIEQWHFLEYARVHSWYYGSPKSELERITNSWKSPIYIIDVQWTFLLKPLLEKEGYRVITIFLTPPSIEIMKERIRSRGSETEADFQIRLESAIKEFAQKYLYDTVVINDNLEKTKNELFSLLKM